MKYITETERLRLRELTLGDTHFIIELLNTPGWLEFIGDRNVKNDEQAKAYLENGPLKSYRLHGYGLWLVEHRETRQPIGMSGILNRDQLDIPDIGFAFLPEFSGQGYAVEMVIAIASLAREKFGIARLAAITVPHNARSIRLLEKIGLKFEKRFRFPDKDEELLLYCSP
ncbi:MAG TPA: GNAT family N-acetyltransferase [Chryseosolibacter sp.]|nr:GNAT family N-acetyltransferase [Chryseosolibacter sp.]